MHLNFLSPYWAGKSLPFTKKEEPLKVGPWEWWFCPVGHSKILKQTPGTCPVCTEPMVRVIDTVEIDGKRFWAVKDHEIVVS